MNETTEFFTILVAIYVAECAVLAPRHAAVVLHGWSAWKVLTGNHFYGNPRWGVFFTHLLPESGAGFVSELWPVSISPTAIYDYVSQAFNPGIRHEQSGRFCKLDDVRTAEPAGRDVMVNGELFTRTASPLYAERLADLIRRLLRAAPARRAATIDDGLRESFDTKAVRERLAEYDAASNWLGAVGNMLLFHLVIVCPLVAWRFGLEMSWFWLLLVLVVLDVLLLVLFHRAHRRLYRRWTSDRWSHLSTMLLLPLAAMRGKSFLSRHLMAPYHPLAVAKIVCDDRVFATLAGSLLRDLQYPIQPVCRSENTEELETEQYFRGRLLAAMEKFLIAEGLDPKQLLASPVRDDPEHRCYCPRCHCQFIVAEGHCENCNQDLKPWPSESAEALSPKM